MKTCPSCGDRKKNNALTCRACMVDLVSEKSTLRASTADVSANATRPDGSIAMHAGAIMLLIGVIAALVGEFMPAAEYQWSDQLDPERLAMKARLAIIGNGLFGIGIISFFSGYVVHAISFLPGKDEA